LADQTFIEIRDSHASVELAQRLLSIIVLACRTLDDTNTSAMRCNDTLKWPKMQPL
jgi:hypothetical protein